MENSTSENVPKTLPKHGRHAEIRDFDVVVVIEKDVFWLEVPMSDATRMQVLDAGKDLFEVTLPAYYCHTNVGFYIILLHN